MQDESVRIQSVHYRSTLAFMCVCASQRIWSGFSRSVIISTVTEKECVCWKTAAKLSKQIGFLLCLGSDTGTHLDVRPRFWFWMGFVFILPKCQKCVMQICYCKDVCYIFFHYSKLCIKWTLCGLKWTSVKYTIKYSRVKPQCKCFLLKTSLSLFIKVISLQFIIRHVFLIVSPDAAV